MLYGVNVTWVVYNHVVYALVHMWGMQWG